MCGIVGIIDFTGMNPEYSKIKAMSNTVAERGPDAEGIKIIPFMGFGHRRLSIIDLSSGGAQPMTNIENSHWIVFNGEIYNYIELKKELLSTGVIFNNNSDTEVVLQGVIAWGPEKFFNKARGMWALAIWNIEKKELILSKDRFGKKPLYYGFFDKKLYFGSSLNSLKVIGINHEINDNTISEFLAFGYVPGNSCIYKNIQKVQPGTYLKILNFEIIEEKQYWDLRYNPIDDNYVQAIEKIDFLLKNAVSDRLVADVEVGSFLSGGVDSALVTAIMAQNQSNTNTFTMKVGGWRNEADRAQVIVNQLKTNHHIIEVKSNEVEILPELIKAYGEPFADSSMIPTALVSKFASKFVKVALTGDGGDESFGGYKEPNQFLNLNKNKVNKFLLPFLQFTLNYRPKFLYNQGRSLEKRLNVSSLGLEGFLNLCKNIDPNLAKYILGKKVIKNYLGMNLMGKYLEIAPNAPDWRKLMYTQFKHRLQSAYLVKVDVASMHYGLETRAPLLDYRLVEYAFNLDFETWNYSDLTKGIFSSYAQKYLPENFINFPKHGFSIPVEEYISNQWKSLFLNLISDGVAEQSGYINSSGIKNMLNHFKGNIPNRISTVLFSIFCLEIWLRQETGKFDNEHFLKYTNA